MNNTAADKTQKWLATTALMLEHDIDDQKPPPMLELTKTTVSDQKMPLIPLETTESPSETTNYHEAPPKQPQPQQQQPHPQPTLTSFSNCDADCG